MIKRNVLRNLLLLLLVLQLSFLFVQAFEVQTLDNKTMEWDKSFCLQDPDDFYELVGNDYYAYCESDFGDEYNAPTNGLIQENVLKEKIIEEPFEESFEEPLEFEKESEIENEEDLTQDNFNELDSIKEPITNKDNNWQLFLGLIGIVLLLVVFILIIAHRMRIKKDEKNQIANLKPYLNNLRKRGYSQAQLEDFLIKKGYGSLFINKLLKQK